MSNYKQIILDALENVVSECYYKEAHNMHEIALCHRLAVHLEKSEEFAGYLIDCDYNRAKKDIKRNPKSKDKNGGFRPDIVVHKRGSGDDNLIMIEAKKASSSQKQKEDARDRLRHNASEYQYKYAFFVVFPRKNVQKDSVVEIKLKY